MRISSYEHLGVGLVRMVMVAAVVSVGSGAALVVVLGSALGGGAGLAALVVGAMVFYLVMTAPRRAMDRERATQARESLALSAAAMACLGVTGSRSKTLMLLKPRDRAFGRATREGARMVLLGSSLDQATAEASKRLASYSAAETLKGIASLQPADFDAGDEETRGLDAYRELYRETKLPMLMTACFFSPIMLVLYAVFARAYDPASLAGLAALEFAVLDLALFFSSVDKGPS